jgi:hypothetical protein
MSAGQPGRLCAYVRSIPETSCLLCKGLVGISLCDWHSVLSDRSTILCDRCTMLCDLVQVPKLLAYCGLRGTTDPNTHMSTFTNRDQQAISETKPGPFIVAE